MKKILTIALFVFSVYALTWFFLGNYSLAKKAITHLDAVDTAQQYYTDTVYVAFVRDDEYVGQADGVNDTRFVVLHSKKSLDSVTTMAYQNSQEKNKCFLIIFNSTTFPLFFTQETYFETQDHRPMITVQKFIWAFIDWVEISRREIAS